VRHIENGRVLALSGFEKQEVVGRKGNLLVILLMRLMPLFPGARLVVAQRANMG
jgi:uncharacterized membrane protein YdjX (TVP38/TMEM64 family)